MLEFGYHQISLLLIHIFSNRCTVDKGLFRLVSSLTHGATCMDGGVDAHVQGGKGFYCKIGNPIMKLVITSCDEATLLAVQFLTYR